jgi:hypothetical protein
MLEANMAYEAIKSGRARTGPSKAGSYAAPQRPPTAPRHPGTPPPGQEARQRRAPDPPEARRAPAPQRAAGTTNRGQASNRARYVGAAVLLVFLALGAVGGLAYASAHFSTKASGFDPRKSKFWSATVKCNTALDERTGSSAADRYRPNLAKTLTTSQTNEAVAAIRTACSHEATNRLKTAGSILFGGVTIGWWCGVFVKRRMQGLDPIVEFRPEWRSRLWVAIAVLLWCMGSVFAALWVFGNGSLVAPLIALPFFSTGQWVYRRHRAATRALAQSQ